MQDARISRGAAWVLRLAAWGIVAAPVLRVALGPHVASVHGMIFQLHGTFERQGASEALESALGLRLRPEISLELAARYGFGLPRFLYVNDATAAPFGPSYYLWVDSAGAVAWPAFHIPAYSPNLVDNTIPEGYVAKGARRECVLVHQSTGKSLSGVSDRRIWMHKDDRWVNVLRLEWRGPGTYPRVIGPKARLERYRIYSTPRVELLWSPEQERFLIPENLPPNVRLLELLPDQAEPLPH